MALGNRQEEGLDFKETFSPVSKFPTVRIFLRIAVARNWELYHMNVHNAFLHETLDEEVYMKLPSVFSHSSPNKVCKLCMSIYGLKQAPRCWFRTLRASLLRLGSDNHHMILLFSRCRMMVLNFMFLSTLMIW